jgi:hypothetical protein
MKIKRTYKRLSPEEIREIKAAVKLGADVGDVAKQYNTTPDTVRKYTKDNIPIAKTRRTRNGQKSMDEIQAELDCDDDEDNIPDPGVVFMSKGERAEQARMGEWYKDKTHWSSIVAEQAQRIQEKTEKLRALRLQKEAEQGRGYGVYSLTSRSEVRFRGINWKTFARFEIYRV